MQRLAVQNLSVSFFNETKYSKALDNLTFELASGEILAIVGESGSGKSITALAIMGLLGRNKNCQITGLIEFFSEQGKALNLNELSDKEFTNIRGKSIAMIFQEPMSALNPVYTCGKQLMECLVLHQSGNKNELYKQALKLLAEVRIDEVERIMNSYPFQISGGQRQRVMVAMALAGSPEVLIADEPTTALDASVRNSILHLIKDIVKERNMSLLLISHDLHSVADISDNIIVLFRGKKLEENHTAKVFKNPQHPYTKALINCQPVYAAKETVLPTPEDFYRLTDEMQFLEKEFDRYALLKLPNKSEGDVLIKAKNLNLSFSRSNGLFKKNEQKQVLNNLSFEIHQSETLGLLGESGSGKSSIAKIFTGLISNYEGLISFEGKDIKGFKRKQLSKKVQLIFQDAFSALNPMLCVGDVLLEVLLVHQIETNKKTALEKAAVLLEQVGLGIADLKKYPHQFSGGQRQRINIARALALEPELIIMDESVSALDVSVQAQIINLLNQLQSKYGFTYLFISHDVDVMAYFSDRVMVLESGTIKEVGITKEVFANPKDAYTRKLLEASGRKFSTNY